MTHRRAWPRRTLAAIACVVALAFGPPFTAVAAEPSIPEPRGYVTDDAHVIGEPRTAQLEGYLVSLREKTGVQFAVLTVATTAPDDPQSYKTRVVKQWKLGDRQHADVLLMLVAMQERRVVFETGYGLEGTLPDGWQSRMLRDLVVPKFREGAYADGITLGVLASAARIAQDKGVEVRWTGDEIRYDASSRRGGRGMPPIVLAFVIFVIVMMLLGATQSRRRGHFGGPWMGGGLGGWGGGFGGGGGGGGDFGGFGGGGGFSSGGGGGGAGW